jgi:hypothetical protein
LGGLSAACGGTAPSAADTGSPETASSDAALFAERCHDCHVPPRPQDFPAAAWPAIVARMQSHRITTGLSPLTDDELRRIQAYLQRNAKDAK